MLVGKLTGCTGLVVSDTVDALPPLTETDITAITQGPFYLIVFVQRQVSAMRYLFPVWCVAGRRGSDLTAARISRSREEVTVRTCAYDPDIFASLAVAVRQDILGIGGQEFTVLDLSAA